MRKPVLQRCLLPGAFLFGVIPVHIVRAVQIEAIVLARMAAGIAALAHIIERAQIAVLGVLGRKLIEVLQNFLQTIEIFQPFIDTAKVTASVGLGFGGLSGLSKGSSFHLLSTRL